jgi:hypothetical protein
MYDLIQSHEVFVIGRLFAEFNLLTLCHEMGPFIHVQTNSSILYGFQVTCLPFIFRDKGGIDVEFTRFQFVR